MKDYDGIGKKSKKKLKEIVENCEFMQFEKSSSLYLVKGAFLVKGKVQVSNEIKNKNDEFDHYEFNENSKIINQKNYVKSANEIKVLEVRKTKFKFFNSFLF